MSQVRELHLNNNDIDGTLPDTIGDAETLEMVRLDHNDISGTIPSTIGRLRNVLQLDMIPYDRLVVQTRELKLVTQEDSESISKRTVRRRKIGFEIGDVCETDR